MESLKDLLSLYQQAAAVVNKCFWVASSEFTNFNPWDGTLLPNRVKGMTFGPISLYPSFQFNVFNQSNQSCLI